MMYLGIISEYETFIGGSKEIKAVSRVGIPIYDCEVIIQELLYILDFADVSGWLLLK